MTAAEIAEIIRSYCYIYAEAKSGKTLPIGSVGSIALIEVRGIEECAEHIAKHIARDDT